MLRGHRSSVNCVAMSADGQIAISGDSDGIVKVSSRLLWDNKNGAYRLSGVADETRGTDYSASRSYITCIECCIEQR